MPPDRVVWRDGYVYVIKDGFAVSEGHSLVITHRHVSTYFDASPDEQTAMWAAVERVKKDLDATLPRKPDGYNVGFNAGAAAGQTIMHVHLHVIPRYEGDVADPRGGVRGVIPAKQNYLASGEFGPASAKDALGLLSRSAPEVLGGTGKPVFDRLSTDLGGAQDVDIAVAFVKVDALDGLYDDLVGLLKAGYRLRFLTGDYLSFTDPNALTSLLGLQSIPQDPSKAQIKVYETSGQVGFHPKAYMLRGRVAYLGSSNLTLQGLTRGIEWNLRIEQGSHPEVLAALEKEFTTLFDKDERAKPLTRPWINQYRERWKKRATFRPAHATVDVEDEPIEAPPEPRGLQTAALEKLGLTRAEGNAQGLVVMATGLGKTWLAAFDVQQFSTEVGRSPRVLFVAHRDEILEQAGITFKRLLPELVRGKFTGEQKVPDADIVLASIQTLSRTDHLHSFKPDEFDYVIVDEFHHACARTYRVVLDYLTPAFLLGLTATPERADGGDLLDLCGRNVVFRADLHAGIQAGELSPFHYYGVPDEVEYDKIPWRSGRFDARALEEHMLAAGTRAQNAFEQWERLEGRKTLGFCVSKKHADYMAEFFVERGAKAVAVHSEHSRQHRKNALAEFRNGELQVLFAVDIFNEGVDVPEIDTVLMLRPTESKVIWLQQIGRGLRKPAEDQQSSKTHLNVIDYIGNHRSFLQGPGMLFPALEDAPAEMKKLFARARDQVGPDGKATLDLGDGCFVTYDLEAIDILDALAKVPKTSAAVDAWYDFFKDRHGYRPSATELWNAGHDPRKVRASHGSWLEFVRSKGDLDEGQATALAQALDFLREVEKTQMNKSYKMVLLLAMLRLDAFPGDVGLDELAAEYGRLLSQSARLRRDASVDPSDLKAVRDSVKKFPITAWTGGYRTGVKEAFFLFEDDRFSSTISVDRSSHENLRGLVREIAEWRLASYLDENPSEGELARMFVCKLSHNSSGPILVLPPRDRVGGIPQGDFPVEVNGETLTFRFVKIAVNVVTRPNSSENVIAEVLRGMFGPEAGTSGRTDQLRLDLEGDVYRAVPIPGDVDGTAATRWQAYKRDEIAGAFGIEYSDAHWRQRGIIFREKEKHLFLLVTLRKEGFREEHQYADRFLSPSLFQWQSQNQNPQSGKIGQTIFHHEDRGIAVHLFVRRDGKTGRGKAAPFIYCGRLRFREWEGEKPITVRWELDEPVPEELRAQLGVPT